MGQTPIQKAVSDILRKYPDGAHRTLAKALHDKNPALFPTIESARAAMRRATGNIGKRDRHKATQPRAPRKPGELPPLPKSEAKPWVPYVLEAKRVVLLGDLHIPYHSEMALESSLKYAKQFKPDALFINGDLFDFYSISRWDKEPDKPKVLHELKCGHQFFAHVRKRLGDIPIHYKLGNHCERWDKYLAIQAPLFFEIEEVRNAWHIPSGITEFGVKVVADQRPVMLGNLPAFHGHELGRNAISSPVNPARGAFLRAHHTVIVSHSHQTSGHADTNIWHEETFCWSVGCLCDCTPRFLPINRWNLGFSCIEVEKDGSFNVHNMRIASDGSVRAS